MKQRVDPVTLEIVRNGLKAMAQRITRRMIRSANSFIVKEMEDCSASILDASGQLLAEEAGPPIQLNTVGICLKTILEHHFPPQDWAPGRCRHHQRSLCRWRVARRHPYQRLPRLLSRSFSTASWSPSPA